MLNTTGNAPQGRKGRKEYVQIQLSTARAREVEKVDEGVEGLQSRG